MGTVYTIIVICSDLSVISVIFLFIIQNPSYYYLLYAYLTAVYIATWVLVCNQQILLASLAMGIFWGQVRKLK